MGQCNKFFRLLPGFMQRFEKIHVWVEAKKTSGCKHPEVRDCRKKYPCHSEERSDVGPTSTVGSAERTFLMRSAGIRNPDTANPRQKAGKVYIGETDCHASLFGWLAMTALLGKKRLPDASIRKSWWGMVDSNHRRRCQQIYSLSPLATREIPHI